jgi:hypothetical protein
MERPSSHVANSCSKESLSKFVTGFTRKSHGEHLVRGDLLIGNASLNAKGQNVGFTRTGGCSHEQTLRGRHHRLALLGGEPDEERVREGRLITHCAYDATGMA